MIPASEAQVRNGKLVTLAQKDHQVDLLGEDSSAPPAPLAIESGEARPVIPKGAPRSRVDIGRFGIAPMNVGIDGARSTLTIEVTREAGGRAVQVGDQFAYRPILKAMPTGLWGKPPTPDLNGAPLIKNALVGFELTPASPTKPGATAAVPRDELADAPHDEPRAFDWGAPGEAFRAKALDDDGRREAIRKALTKSEVTAKRGRVLSALGLGADASDPAGDLADDFLVAPLIESIESAT